MDRDEKEIKMRKVKVAAIQMQCSVNIEDNIKKAEEQVRAAANNSGMEREDSFY